MASARCCECSWEVHDLPSGTGLTAWQTHHDRTHGSGISQLPTVDWHTQALQAIRALAMKGEPFVIADVQRYGVTDPPHPRTDWPKVTAEAEQYGWIEHCGYAKSTRPTVRGSAVRQWRGTYAVRRAS